MSPARFLFKLVSRILWLDGAFLPLRHVALNRDH